MRAITLFVLLLTSFSAHAYIGPGLGLGVLGALLGGILAVVLAIVGVIWYPVKRLLKRSKTSNEDRSKPDREAPREDREELERTSDA